LALVLGGGVLGVGGTVLFAGCGEGDEAAEEEELIAVPDGKADNFFSLSAQEYMVEGRSYVELEDEYADQTEDDRLARVKQIIYYKQISINWFLLKFLMGNEEHENKYESLTKNGSYEDLEVTADPDNPLKYTFLFRQEVGGQMDLLEELPTTTGADGRQHISLPVGKVPNGDLEKLDINDEWYRKAPWSQFDPAKTDASLIEQLDLAIWPEERSSDAWIDYKRLTSDGELTVSVHFGWDYHKEYHLVHSKDVYDWLVSEGFKSPVKSYDKYTRTSGPLTRTQKADGKNVNVKVWLFWGKKGTSTDPDTDAGGKTLEKDMRAALKNRDVVIFSGHSGPFYGFALANWRKTDEGDLDDAEIPSVSMPANKYQVILAEGCDTYALGQAFFSNPAKSDKKNLDVITTTNFSNASTASTVRNFISSFTALQSGTHTPWKFSDLLQKLDGGSSWFHSMYGVHGIDDNPRVHPYGHADSLCGKCSKDSDCGGPGNRCIKLNDSEKVCSIECVGKGPCPDGYECRDVASGYYVQSKQCLPSKLTCKTSPAPQDSPAVMVNEILADPASDLSGDANRDGKRDASKDEFVELVSLSAAPADISGWSISDSTGSRFVFPEGTSVLPGRAIVVFGGGDASKVADLTAETGSLMFLGHGLGLDNGGDTLTLTRADGTVADTVAYGALAGKDRSIVREIDADPAAAFVVHPGDALFSPGTKSDGNNF